MSAPAVKKLRGNIYKVGIFVNAPVDEVLRLVDECGLYLVQLHGDESPRTCEKISNYISVIKAFRISEHENIEWKIREYYDAADMFLFDTNFTDTKETNYGGTGIKFNWELLKGKNIHKPFFLGGGIDYTDAEAIKQFSNDPVAKHLFAIDINSKFELMPGVKDMEKVKKFLTTLKP
jgi:phosphoribosylanthranilate isomerase